MFKNLPSRGLRTLFLCLIVFVFGSGKLAAETVTSIVRADSNPSNLGSVNYDVTFDGAVAGLTAANFTLTVTGVTGASVGVPVDQGAGLIWTVPVNTGSGDGTIRLDMDNSTSVTPVVTNVPFTSGQVYDIDKTAPIFQSATAVDDVTIQLKYNEPVTPTFTDPADWNSAGFTSSAAVSNVDPTIVDLTVSSLANTAFSTADLALTIDDDPNDRIIDGAGNIAVAVSSQAVSDGQAPNFEVSFPSTSVVTSGGFRLTSDQDENGTAYYVVVPDGAGVPSSTEVQALTGSGGSGQVAAGSISDAGGSAFVDVAGLTGNTDYDVYVVAVDGLGNLQPTSFGPLNVTTLAATTLSPGDIAFTMINSNGADEFAFMLLQPIEAGTEIHFVDHGINAAGTATTDEGALTYVASEMVVAGEQIIVNTTSALRKSNGATVGSIVVSDAGWDITGDPGDQITAFQGTIDGPGAITATNFLSAVNTSSAGWTVAPIDDNHSDLPSALTDQVTAVSLFDGLGTVPDRGIYDFSNGFAGSLVNMRRKINNPTNWASNTGGVYVIGDLVDYGGNPSTPSSEDFFGFTRTGITRAIDEDFFIFNDTDGADDQDGLQSVEITAESMSPAATLFYDQDLDGTNNQGFSAVRAFTRQELIDGALKIDLTGVAGDDGTFNYSNVSDGENTDLASYTFTGKIVNNALDFDGNSDLANLGDIMSLSSVAEFTIEGWLQQATLDQSRGVFFKEIDANTGIKMFTHMTGGIMRIEVNSGGTAFGSFDYSTVVSANTWFHFAMVYDGGGATDVDKLKLYINGSEQTLSYTGTIPATTADLTGVDMILGDAGAGINDWDGLMDELRIWDDIRTPGEITSNMRNYINAAEPGLIAYYTFDHGDPGVANDGSTLGTQIEDRLEDETGNGNHGQLDADFALTGATSNWVNSTAFDNEIPAINNLSDADNDNFTFTEDDPATIIDGGDTPATITDADNPTDINGAKLTVSVSANGVGVEDVLAIVDQGTGSGLIDLTTNPGSITIDAVVVATYTGGTGAVDLEIDFNVNATLATATLVLQNITYQNVELTNPTENTRTVSFVYYDGITDSNQADVSITVAQDVVAPLLVSTSPVDGSNNQLWNGNIVLTFDDNMQAGPSGNIVITGDGGYSEIIAEGDPKVTYLDNVVTINPMATFVKGENYEVTIAVGALQDDGGNDYAGMAAGELNFTPVDIVINEVVNDPQQDWSTDGFVGTIGGVTVTQGTDEWVELFINSDALDLTGWTIELNDGSDVIGDLTNTGAFDNSVYAGAGSFNNTSSGDYLVLGDVDGGGDMTLNITILLRDPNSDIIDQVVLSNPGNPNGNGAGVSDESVFRLLNGTDTDVDAADFRNGAATMGAANNAPPTVAIARLTPANASTDASAVIFRVTFNEDVYHGADMSTLILSDFVKAGTVTGGSVTGILEQTTNRIFNVTISGYTGVGTVDLDFNPAHDIVDVDAGNKFFEALDITAEESYTIVAPDSNSDFTDQMNEAVGFDYALYQDISGLDVVSDADPAQDAIRVWSFDINDNGAPGDNMSTVIETITIDVTSSSASLGEIRALAIFQGATNIGEITTITASNLIDIADQTIANGSSTSYDVWVSFNAPVTDKNQFTFEITAVGQPTSNTSIVGSFVGPSASGGAENTIEVIADHVEITSFAGSIDPEDVSLGGGSTDEINVALSVPFSVTAEAQDALGSVDVDYDNSTPTDYQAIISVTTPGSFGGSLTQDWLSGVATWTNNLVYSAVESGEVATITDNHTPNITASFTRSYTVSENTSDVYETSYAYVPIPYIGFDSDDISRGDTDAVKIAEFAIRDGGVSGASDGARTRVESLIFEFTSGAANVKRLAMFVPDGTGVIANAGAFGTNAEVDEFAGPFTNNTPIDFDFNRNTIQTSGGSNVNEHFQVENAKEVIIEIWASFNANVTDNEVIDLVLTDALDDTGSGRTGFQYSNGHEDGGPDPTETTLAGDENRIEVTATQWVQVNTNGYANPMASSTTFERDPGFSIEVEAQDGQNNLDVDVTGAPDFTFAAGGIINSIASSFSGGIYSEEFVVINNVFGATPANVTFDVNPTVPGLNPLVFNNVVIQDTTVPSVEKFTPMDDANDVVSTTTLTVEFSEDMQIGTGVIEILNLDDFAIIETIDVTDIDKVSLSAKDFTTDLATITLAALLPKNKNVAVRINATVFSDLGANNYAGINNTTTWNFYLPDTGPVIIDVDPFDTESNVATATAIIIEFDDIVYAPDDNDATTTIDRINLNGDNGTGSIDYNTNSETSPEITGYGTSTITITPAAAFNTLETVTVTVPESVFENANGTAIDNSGGDYVFTFQTNNDVTPPALVTFPYSTPNHGAINVPLDIDGVGGRTIEINFDDNIFFGTGGLRLRANTNPDLVSSNDFLLLNFNQNDPELSIVGSDLFIDISALGDLAGNTEFYVTISAGLIEDVNGNNFAGILDETVLAFTTTNDAVNPTVTNLTPADGSSTVGVNTDLQLSFNEPIAYTGVGALKIIYFQNSAIWENYDLSIDVDDDADPNNPLTAGDGIPDVINYGYLTFNANKIVISPSGPLSGLVPYAVLIDATALADNSGNPFAGVVSKNTWNFTTIAEPDNTDPPTVVSFNSPADMATDVSLTPDLVFTMSEPIEGVPGGFIRIEEVGGGATYSIDAEDGAIGVFGAQVTVNTIAVDPAIVLDYNTDYYVEISAGDISDRSDVPSNAIIGGDGVWNFHTVSDVAAPVVQTLLPDNGAPAVPTAAGTTFTMIFDENVLLGSGNITLYYDEPGATPDLVLATLDVITDAGLFTGAGTNTLSFDFDLLSGNSDYYITIDDGAITDINNDVVVPLTGYDATGTWNFQTDNAGGAASLVSFSPANGTPNLDVVNDDQIVLTFSEYVTPINTKNITIYYDDNPAPGDMTGDQAAFVIPVDHSGVVLQTVNGEYVFTYDISDIFGQELPGGGVGYYAILDDESFADNDGNLSPATAFGDDTSWTFTTDPSTDIIAPAMISFAPADGDFNVTSGTGALTITFNERVTPNTGNLDLYLTSDNASPFITIPVGDAVINHVDRGSVVTFNLEIDNQAVGLTGNRLFYINLDNQAFQDNATVTTNKSTAITGLSAWNFGTDATDASGPQLLTKSPLDDLDVGYVAGSALISGDLVLRFDEPVYLGTGNITVTINPPTAPRTIVVAANNGSAVNKTAPNEVTIDLPQDLDANGVNHSVQISGSAFKDASNNFYAGIGNDTDWNFTTTDGVQVVAATTARACIGRDAVPVASAITITESNITDLPSSGSVTYEIGLTDGFIFNTGASSSVSATMGTDLSGISHSYPDDYTLQIVYQVDAEVSIDQLTISGLEINIENANVESVDVEMFRTDGTAYQPGNETYNQQVHLNLQSEKTLDPGIVLTNTTVCEDDNTVALSGNQIADFDVTASATPSHTLHWYANNDYTGDIVSFPEGTITDPSFNDLTFNASITGAQTVYLSQTNDTGGCESDLVPVVVTVLDLPIADAGTAAYKCNATEIELGAAVPATGGAGGYTYSWTGPVVDQLDYSNASGSFTISETITGASSGATAVIDTDVAGTLTLSSIVGTFRFNEEIEGASSGVIADISGYATSNVEFSTLPKPTIEAPTNTDNSATELYNYDLTVTDSENCISLVSTKAVTIDNYVDIGISASATTYTSDDEVGGTLSGSLNAVSNYTVLSIVGIGLTDIDLGGGAGPGTAKFKPAIAGSANSPFDITYEIRSDDSPLLCKNTDFITLFVNEATDPIRNLNANNDYCNGEVDSDLQIEHLDLPVGFVPWKLVGSGISGIDGNATGWTFTPQVAFPTLTAGGTVQVTRIITNDGGTNQQPFGAVTLNVNALPVVSIGDISATYCENESALAPVIFTGDAVGDIDGNGSGTMTVERLSDNVTFNLPNSSGDYTFDTANPVNSLPFEAGNYTVTYVSGTADDPNGKGCVNTVVEGISVFAQPSIPVLDDTAIDAIAGPALTGVPNTYLVEYCDGEIVADLTISSGTNKWYPEDGSTGMPDFGAPIATGNATGQVARAFELFGTTTPAVGNYEFFFTQTANGCESEYATVEFEIYDIPVDPVVTDFEDIGSGTIHYVREYCQGETIQNVVINPAIVSDDIDFYDWYQADGSTLVDGFDTSTDVVEDDLSQGDFAAVGNVSVTATEFMGQFGQGVTPTPGTYTLTFRKRQNRNASTLVFDGCESALVRVDIVVYGLPTAPTPINDFITDINACSGELTTLNLNKRIAVSDEVATPGITDVRYTWYPANAFANAIGNVDGSDLTYDQIFDDGNVTGLDDVNDTEGTNTYYQVSSTFNVAVYLSQVTNFLNRQTTAFVGCESATLTPVDITIYPLESQPNILGPSHIDDLVYTGGTDEILNFEAGALTADSLFDASSDFVESVGVLEYQFNWYFSNSGGAQLSQISIDATKDATAKANELGLAGLPLDAQSYFLINQTTNIEIGSGFAGCESDFSELQVNTWDEPSIPTEIAGLEDIYYCEGDAIQPIQVENNALDDSEPNLEFRWYNSLSDATAHVNELTSTNLTGLVGEYIDPADLDTDETRGDGGTDMSGAPEPKSYTFYVTVNKDNGVAGSDDTFRGGESSPREITLHVLANPDAPVISGADNNICFGADSPVFRVTNSASGAVFNWYDNNTSNDGTTIDGPIISGAATPNWQPNDAGDVANKNFDITALEGEDYNFLSSQTTNINIGGSGFAGCESPTTHFDIIVHTIPTPPTIVGNIHFGDGAETPNEYEYCSDETITNLVVETPVGGVEYKWYTSDALDTEIINTLAGSFPDGSVLEPDDRPGFPVITSSTDQTISYYVTATENGCESKLDAIDGNGTRYRWVTVKVNPLPIVDIVDEGAGPGSPTDEFCFDEINHPRFEVLLTTVDGIPSDGQWQVTNSLGTNITASVAGSPRLFDFELDTWYNSEYAGEGTPGDNGRGEVTGAVAETFQLEYTYTDGNGCTVPAVENGAIETITVNPLPHLTIANNLGLGNEFDAVPFNPGSTVEFCAGDHNLTDYMADTEQDRIDVEGVFVGSTGNSVDSDFTLIESGNLYPLSTSNFKSSFTTSALGDTISLTTARTFDILFVGEDTNGCINEVTQPIVIQALPEVTFEKISGGCENPAVEFVPQTLLEALGGSDVRKLPYTIGNFELVWEYYRTNADGSINTAEPYPPTEEDPYDPFAPEGTMGHDPTWEGITGGLYSVAADGDGDIRDFGSVGINETFLIADADAEGETFAARLKVYTNDPNQCLNDFQDANNVFATRPVDIEISPNPAFRWEDVALGESTKFYMRETRLASEKIEDIYLFWDRYVTFDELVNDLVTANDTISQTAAYTVPIPTINLPGEANDVFEYTIDPASIDPNLNPFTEAREYIVTVAFRTSNDCYTALAKSVNIVPSIDVVGDYGGTYHQTFGPEGDGTGPFDLITSGWFPENLRDDALLIADSTESIRPYSWTHGDLNNGSANNLISSDVYPQFEESDGYAWHTAALDGSGATNTYNYQVSEDSWIYSPSFDITGMSRPMVKFTMIHNFGAGNEGAVLQHSTDGGVTWIPLGSYETNTGISTGLDWFNFDNVQADPGQQTSKFGALTALGWAGGASSGKSVEWLSARHSLNEIEVYLAEQLSLSASEIQDRLTNVRFRFAIAATNLDDNDNYFGFALDDFTIQERTKNVMIEQFVSASNDDGAEEVNDPTIALKAAIDDLLPPAIVTNRDEVVLAYHTDFGFGDPFNLINPSGPSARSIYYNVDQVTSILDGQLGGNSSSAKSGDLTWTQTDLSLSALKDPGFNIILTADPTASATEIKGTVQFEANQDYAIGTEFRAYVVILEDTVVQSIGGINGFGNVMRKLLPSGSGNYVKLTEELTAGESLPFGETTTMSVSWSLANIKDDANLSAIVFIQNSKTKEIYQSVRIDNSNDFVSGKNTSTITDIEDGILAAKDFNMYPNPTDHEVFILFDQLIQEDMQWSIFDQTGRIFDQGEIHSGREGFSLQTDRFPSGLYYMSIRGEKSEFEFKKLMITH